MSIRMLLQVTFHLHVLLNDTSPNHGSGSGEESKGHALDRGEVDTKLAKARVDDPVADGDENLDSKEVRGVDENGEL